MGLFSDTLHDARRPLSPGWVRRSAESDEPVADLPDLPSPSGMNTVFRFQKAEVAGNSVGLHGASSQVDAAYHRVVPGDPLSVVAAVARPSPATRVGGDIDLNQVKRGVSEPLTGQELSGTDRIAEAPGDSGPLTSHSVSQSVGITPEMRKLGSLEITAPTEITNGNEKPVNERSDTLSGPPGRGAPPSETSSYLAVDPPPRTEPAIRPTVPVAKAAAAERLHITTAMPVDLPDTPAVDVPVAASVSTPMVTPAAAATAAPTSAITAPTPPRGATRAAGLPGKQAATVSQRMPLEDIPAQTAAATEVIATAVPSPAAPHQTASEIPAATRATPSLPGFPSRAQPAPRAAADAPKLVIGRIDVVVVAEAPPAPAARPAASDHGFMSRNYLKRL